MANMMAFNQSLVEAGVMLSGNGLVPTSQAGARITFGGSGQTTVASGPFAVETVVSGYWILLTDTMQEAIQWAQKAPIKDGTLEVRQVAEFGGNDA